MIKNNKWQLIISSVIILLPAIVGLIIWELLPDVMTTHWGIDGIADGRSGKTFAVFALPVIMLAVHWICVLGTSKDPGNKNQNKKALSMVLWICPFLSLFSSGIMFSISLGAEFNITKIMLGLIGLMFVVIGNYMPKCKQNYTLGIKISWTLGNEENWNKTHRFAGKVWVIGGLLVMLMIFLPTKVMPYLMLPILLIIVLIPVVYSYVLSRKQRKEGAVFLKHPYTSKMSKTALVISGVLVVVIIVAVIVIMFTGNVNVVCGESSMTIEATYWDDLTLAYDDIDNVEYREDCDAGIRTYGFCSARLLLGSFENDEFGNYTRYSYTGCDACVVFEIDGKILVIGGENEADTLAIYDEIMERM